MTEFKRNSTGLVTHLKSTGRPLVLTVNGKAELVVQDAATYQKLLDRVEAIEGIARGIEEGRQGKTRNARKSLEGIRKKHRIPKK